MLYDLPLLRKFSPLEKLLHFIKIMPVLSLRLTCLYFNGIEKMYRKIASLCLCFILLQLLPQVIIMSPF